MKGGNLKRIVASAVVPALAASVLAVIPPRAALAALTKAVRSYTFDGMPVATRSGAGVVEYLVTDAAGSVEMSVASGAAAPLATRSYEPFGQVRAKTGDMATDAGFLGQIEDASTGLSYLTLVITIRPSGCSSPPTRCSTPVNPSPSTPTPTPTTTRPVSPTRRATPVGTRSTRGGRRQCARGARPAIPARRPARAAPGR